MEDFLDSEGNVSLELLNDYLKKQPPKKDASFLPHDKFVKKSAEELGISKTRKRNIIDPLDRLAEKNFLKMEQEIK